jgi:3-dehydroquinate dehydratase II
MQETTRPRIEEAEPTESIVDEAQRIVQTNPLPEAVDESELKVLLINGPNLNLLGKRQPDIYGSVTLQEIEEKVAKRARELEVDVRCFQSNHEGAIVDFLQKEGPTASGIIINPGALTHYSYTLRDALEAIDKPTVEVHITNIHARELFRRRTITGDAADAVIAGLGWHGYIVALESLFTIPITRKRHK